MERVVPRRGRAQPREPGGPPAGPCRPQALAPEPGAEAVRPRGLEPGAPGRRLAAARQRRVSGRRRQVGGALRPRARPHRQPRLRAGGSRRPDREPDALRLFLPEKREFFLENAGVFEFGTRALFEPPPFLLFFSRSIGIKEDEGEVPVLGGVRLSGRAGRQTIGFLSVLQDEAFGDPRTNFGALRVKRDVGASRLSWAPCSRTGARETAARPTGASTSRRPTQKLNLRASRPAHHEGQRARVRQGVPAGREYQSTTCRCARPHVAGGARGRGRAWASSPAPTSADAATATSADASGPTPRAAPGQVTAQRARHQHAGPATGAGRRRRTWVPAPVGNRRPEHRAF